MREIACLVCLALMLPTLLHGQSGGKATALEAEFKSAAAAKAVEEVKAVIQGRLDAVTRNDVTA